MICASFLGLQRTLPGGTKSSARPSQGFCRVLSFRAFPLVFAMSGAQRAHQLCCAMAPKKRACAELGSIAEVGGAYRADFNFREGQNVRHIHGPRRAKEQRALGDLNVIRAAAAESASRADGYEAMEAAAKRLKADTDHPYLDRFSNSQTSQNRPLWRHFGSSPRRRSKWPHWWHFDAISDPRPPK